MDGVLEVINCTADQLERLDESNADYHTQKAMLETIMKNSKQEYANAESTNGMQEPSENGNLSLPAIDGQQSATQNDKFDPSSNGFASYDNAGLHGFGGPLPSDGGSRTPIQLPRWASNNIDSTIPTPDSATFPSGDDQSTSDSNSGGDSGFVRPQKRQRESIGGSSFSARPPNKSIRTSPSPAITASTTPTSQSSFELPDDPDFLALLGGNPAQDLREMREEQMEQQRILEARKQQELADADFARRLMEQDSSPSSSRPVSSASFGNNAQAVLDNQGRYRRSLPFAFSSPVSAKSQDHFMTSTLPANQERSMQKKSYPARNEASQRSAFDEIPSSDFIDLENDEAFQQPPDQFGTFPSSDLVEIDSRTFGRNSRESKAESSLAGAQNSYYTSGSSASGPSYWGSTAGQLGNSLYNAASTAFNGAYNMLDNQIGSYGNVPAGFGGTSVYGSNLQGSSPDIIDLESYDQTSYPPYDAFSRHGIDAYDPANQDLVAAYRNRVDYITNDPTRTSAEIKSLLENIRPDEDLPPENREGTPEAMTYALMEHQKLGLAWMKSMEEGSNRGGILADDMGLGKTIQALALIVARNSNDRACKTTLIVCPVALLRQWAAEIKSKLKPNHQLKVYTLHSEKRCVDWTKLRNFDVVLTTYGRLFGYDHFIRQR